MKITKKHVFSFSILSLFFLVQIFFFLPTLSPARANDNLLKGQVGINEVKYVYGNPTGEALDVRYVAARIIQIVLSFIGIIFLILLIIAGYRYMMASGNEEAITKSTSQIKTAIIGLIITMGAWAITHFVIVHIEGAVSNRVDILYPL